GAVGSERDPGRVADAVAVAQVLVRELLAAGLGQHHGQRQLALALALGQSTDAATVPPMGETWCSGTDRHPDRGTRGTSSRRPPSARGRRCRNRWGGRTHRRRWRERDKRAGRLGGFGQTGQERGRTVRPRVTAADVLRWALPVGAVGALALRAGL